MVTISLKDYIADDIFQMVYEKIDVYGSDTYNMKRFG